MLKDFADKKQMLDLSDRFNIILFNESGPLYLEDFTFDMDRLLDLLKENEKNLVRANIAGGIFVAATFIIDVYKKISDKAFRLIIFTDRGSLNIPEQYMQVLIELLDKVKDMPFFLDTLRIGTNDPAEDVKLLQLAKRYGGDIFDIKAPKILHETLQNLAEKKILPQERSFGPSTGPSIRIENQLFYENLADDPIILVSEETCSICFKKDDKTVVQCPNCETIAHMSCWAHWAKTSNIGMPYVFRCHQCFNLVKLNQEFVAIVQEGKEPAPEVGRKLDLVSYLRELEAKNKPKVIQEVDPLAVSTDEYGDFDDETVFGEFNGDLETSSLGDITFRVPPQPKPKITFSSPDSTQLESIPMPTFEESKLEPIPQPQRPPQIGPQLQARSRQQQPAPKRQPIPTSIPPPQPEEAKPKKKKKKKDVSVVFCPFCSTINTGNSLVCKNCGHRL